MTWTALGRLLLCGSSFITPRLFCALMQPSTFSNQPSFFIVFHTKTIYFSTDLTTSFMRRKQKHMRPSVSLYTLLFSALDGWQRINRARLLLGCLLLLGQVLDDLLLLGLEALLSALTCLLCLETAGLGLITAGQRCRYSV